LKLLWMGPVMRYVPNIRRPALAGAIGFLSLGCVSLSVVSLGIVASLGAARAQTQLQPGEVPFLNYAPSTAPVNPPLTPPAPRLELRPSNVPAGKDAGASPGGKEAGSLDALKQRDRELAALREQQQRATENEAKLKREIETIGTDRRKFNAQLI